MSFRIDPRKGLKALEITEAEETAKLNKALNLAAQPYTLGSKKINLYFYVNFIKVKQRVQFGESLYIRGDGFSVMKDGVMVKANWDRGIQMENLDADSWQALVNTHTTEVAFKILINDKIWEEGKNHDFDDMVHLAGRLEPLPAEHTMKHKGYQGIANYDDEAKIFHGEVVGLKAMITFQGTAADQLEQAFKNSIDDYLNFCKKKGRNPEKPLY